MKIVTFSLKTRLSKPSRSVAVTIVSVLTVTGLLAGASAIEAIGP